MQRKKMYEKCFFKCYSCQKQQKKYDCFLIFYNFLRIFIEEIHPYKPGIENGHKK